MFSPLIDETLLFEMPVSPGYYKEAARAWKKQVLGQRDKEYGIKLAVSPAFVTDRMVFAGTPDGLARSTDGGSQWERLGGNVLDEHAYVESVAVSPNYSQDRTLFVSARGQGLLQSRDGGDSFSIVGSSLMENNTLLAHYPSMTPKFPTISFSPTYRSDKTLYAFSGPKLFRSKNNGETWEVLRTPTVTLSARALAWYRGYFLRFLVRVKQNAFESFLFLLLCVGVAYGIVKWVRHRKDVQRAQVT